LKFNVDLDGAKKLQKEILALQKKFPEEVKSMLFEVALVDIETFAKDKANIPVDTGRLRASIHTSYSSLPNPSTSRTKQKLKEAEAISGEVLTPSKTTYNYSVDGKSYDGTLSEKPEEFEVIVGTNVEYAEKINRVGGGGPNSNRSLNSKKNRAKFGTRQGPTFPKGWGKGYFDKAVANGRTNLLKEMRNLKARLMRIIKDQQKKAGD